MDVTFKLKDGMKVAKASAEEASAFGFEEGQKLVVLKSGSSFILVNEENAEQMKIAMRIMDENHEVLAKLAQSERMDMVGDIMDEYDEALTELVR